MEKEQRNKGVAVSDSLSARLLADRYRAHDAGDFARLSESDAKGTR